MTLSVVVIELLLVSGFRVGFGIFMASVNGRDLDFPCNYDSLVMPLCFSRISSRHHPPENVSSGD